MNAILENLGLGFICAGRTPRDLADLFFGLIGTDDIRDVQHLTQLFTRTPAAKMIDLSRITEDDRSALYVELMTLKTERQ